jgi:serine/threonine-protein kinase
MDAGRSETVQRLFHEALELQPSQRDAFLATACAGDEQLRAEVAELIVDDEAGLPILEAGMPALAGAVLHTDSAVDPLLGKFIGP